MSPPSTAVREARARVASRPLSLDGTRILVVMASTPLQGMERANLAIMELMRERGAEVLFVTHARYGDRVRREVERIGCRWDTAAFDELLRLPRSPGDLVKVTGSWVRTAWRIHRICRRFRPTHVHVTNLSYMLHALPAIWRGTARVVFRLPTPPDGGLDPKRQRLSDWIWRRWVAPACDVLVCNSTYTASRLRRLLHERDGARRVHGRGAPADKVRVIHNCLPRRPRPAVSDMPSIPDGRVNVAFLGRIRPEKGVQELFDAAVRIVRERPDVDFYLAGENHWRNPLAEELMRITEEEGLASRIRFTGEIDDVFGLLGRCHLHVLPSHAESFPNVVLEAKSAGLPSVVFPTTGVPETVTHGIDGYVCADASADALYRGLRFFLDDLGARRRGGEAARRSLDRYAPERIADQWAALFAAETR